VFSVRNEDSARHRCGTQQLFLPALPAGAEKSAGHSCSIQDVLNMRAVIQRVRRARVSVDQRAVGEIGAGVLVLLGVGKGDSSEAAKYLAEKTASLRIFNDADGKMNLSLLESGGSALVVSQFTLYGDVRRGRRPGFDRAAPPAEANRLYEEYVASLKALGVPVQTGIFQAHMVVELENDGPVTILVDSEKTF
jgi:D-tyrosyl-tRNA(Tyr) deacylase